MGNATQGIRLILCAALPLLACGRGGTSEGSHETPVFRRDALLTSAWQEFGPSPYITHDPTTEPLSGQVSAIAADTLNDPSGNTVYVGSSSGGLWKSSNGLGTFPHFQLISDQTRSLSVGAVAVDGHANPPTIYVGTGAPDNSANVSANVGTGLLISRDGGVTWTSVNAADGGAHPFAGLGFSRIIIDPIHPSTLVASTGVGVDGNFPLAATTQGSSAVQHLGIYRSTDSGSTWSRTLATPIASVGAAPFFHIDVLQDPARSMYFAAVSQVGFFRSTDGATWSSFQSLGLGNGLPPASQQLRVSLANRAGRLWALIMVPPVPPGTVATFQLFKSEDAGNTWIQLPFNAEPSKGFLMYTVAPPGSNRLLVGLDSLWRKDDIDDPNELFVNIDQSTLHGDQHAFFALDSDRWYVGDDGGAFVTRNHGDAWNSLNQELRSTEFFSAAADSADSGTLAGGQQDNGVGFSSAVPNWTEAAGGDGTYVVADPKDSTGFFFSQPFGSVSYLRVSGPGASTVLPILPNPNNQFGRPLDILPNDPRLSAGVPPPPGLDFNQARFLLAGGPNPMLVAYDPTTQVQLATTLATSPNGPVQYLASVPGDATTAYLSANNALFRLTNIGLAGSSTLSAISGGPVNGDLLGPVAVSPQCASAVYLIKVGFIDGQKIFKTTDGGVTWLNISGNLPNTALNWVTVDRDAPNVVYIGTNIGAFVATDGGVPGEQWQPLGSGLPRIPVMQLQLSAKRRLVAATYGRGVWLLDVGAPPASPAPQVPLLNQALLACGSTATVNSGALVDSFSSCRGDYGGINVASHGDVVASLGITVNSGGQIHGAQRPRTPCTAGPFAPPAGLASSGDLNVNSPQPLPAGDYRFNNININSGGSITGSGGLVRIWYSGSLNFSGPATGASGLAANLWFFGLPGSGAVNVNSNVRVVGNIYTPNANVTIDSPSSVFGGIVGRQVILNSNASLHFDQAENGTPCCGVQ